MKVCFLEEERKYVEDLIKERGISGVTFVSKADLKKLKDVDILFVMNDINLYEFLNINEPVNHNILETVEINYIIIKDLDLFCNIYNNFNEILIVKFDEYKNRVFKTFRIKDKKYFSIVVNFENYFYVLDENGEYMTIDGKRCKKVYDYDIYNENCYEKDVKKYKRFSILTSKKIKFNTNYRTLIFDIETLASVDSINTPEPIISIAAHDSLTDEIRYWDLREKSIEKEKAMLEEFFTYVSNFDIIAGFNIMKFDLPYIINRAIKIGADTSLLSNPNTEVFIERNEKDINYPWTIKIFGINIIDLYLSSIRAIAYMDVKLPDNKLDTMAKYILNESKIEIDTPAALWHNKDYEKLKEYNIQDVKITCKLNSKLGIIDLLVSTLEFVKGLNLEDCNFNSKIIDFYLLANSKYVLPSINKNQTKNIEGAIVFEPKPGIYSNVAVFDVASMYPNIIRTFNISPDTMSEKGEININNIRYLSSKKGILVEMIDNFMNLKEKYKNLKKKHINDKDYNLYQLREFATKKILSSVYGVFGFVGFRLFNNDIANSITFVGRELLKHMRENAVNNNYKVILGDTDSIFIQSDKDNFEDYLKIINDSLFSFVSRFTDDENIIKNHKISIEYETLFKKIIIPPAKKKYIGIAKIVKGKTLDKPQLYFKGSELNKKDVPFGLKDEIRKLVLSVLNNETEDNIYIIKSELKRIKNNINKLRISDLLIYKEINRNFNSYKVKPQHVRAAENSNKYLNTDFSRENYRGGILYVKSKKYPEIEVLFMNDKLVLDKDFNIDYDKYYEKFILEKIRLIFGDDIYNLAVNNNHKLTDYFI